MVEYGSIEDVEKEYTPEDVKKYPIVLRLRVTQYEASIIKEWIRRGR